VVYVGADALTARRPQTRVDFAWESRVPFVPRLVWVYSSIYLVFLAAPLVLRRERQIRSLAATLSVVTLAGGVGFLLLPARLAYPPAPLQAGPLTAALMRLSDRVNLTYNLVPSLHVALSTATLGAMGTRAGGAGRALIALAAGTIGLSTMLTHQHHLVDVLAGYAVAAAAVALVYRPLSAGSGGRDTTPSNTAAQPSSGLRASGFTSPRR
jgi:membrane-associated phospholipid phosphatase